MKEIFLIGTINFFSQPTSELTHRSIILQNANCWGSEKLRKTLCKLMTIDGYICGRKTCKIHSYLLLERQFMRSGICIATTTTFFFIISQACAICINTLPNFLANPNEYNHYYVCVNNVTFFFHNVQASSGDWLYRTSLKYFSYFYPSATYSKANYHNWRYSSSITHRLLMLFDLKLLIHFAQL